MMIDRDAASGAPARLLDELPAIVGRRCVLTSPQSTRRYRTGFRFGTGPALAVGRPGTLVEQWKVLNARAGAEYIVSADSSYLTHQQGCAERIGVSIKSIHIAQILNGAST